MEMYYDGALVMPKNYAVVDAEEMEYVDGGFYISKKAVDACCTVFVGCAAATWKSATAAAVGFGAKLAMAFNKFSNWLCGCGVAGCIVKVVCLIGAACVGAVFGNAWYYDKGIDVSLSGIRLVD